MASLSKLTMKLFGIPYQFPPQVDPRLSDISTVVGKKFTETIMLEAPVCTIIPGVASYLPGSSGTKQVSVANALIEAVDGNYTGLKQITQENTDDDLRLYDFKADYPEYMKYVNILCRSGAVFLDLTEEINIGGTSSTFQKFDWRNYRWNNDATTSIISRAKTSAQKTVTDKSKGINSNSSSKYEFEMESEDSDGEISLNEVLTNYNFVQFYIDPDVSPSDSLSNSTGESMLKSAVDQGGSVMKDIAFMANSGGLNGESLNSFMASSASALEAGVSSILGDTGNLGGAVSRLVNLGGSVLQGHNIIIPNIYQNSTYSKSYSLTVHLKSPYGTKLGYYLDIFVPMMHLLALAMPRQESANSFSSPFLVKAYVDGLFSCNLGLVESISISKITDTRSVSGLPTEVDVTLNITDLYSDLMMSPSNDPLKFANNSSLIEFLAVNCGMSLTAPNFKKKFEFIINNVEMMFEDVPATVLSTVQQKFHNLIDDFGLIYK